MHDEYVNKGKVITLAAWGVVVALMLSGWVTMVATPEHWKVAGMLAATACASSALAATLHIKCYAVRLSCLMRATSGLREGAELHGPHLIRD